VLRLILLVHHPYHLGAQEAERWLREQASALLAADGVRRAGLSPVGSASVGAGDPSGWLIELDCDGPEGADRTVRSGAWTDLLGDLRLLGMRPMVAVVGETSELRE
jgi:hypothetical protein